MWIINPSITPTVPGPYPPSPPAPIIVNGAGPTIDSCEVDFDASHSVQLSPYQGPNVVSCIEGSSPLFHNCRILSHNTLFYVTGGSVLSGENCLFDGVHVHANGGTVILSGSLLTHTAVMGYLGALDLENSASALLTNCAIIDGSGNGIDMVDVTGTGIFPGTVTARNLLVANWSNVGIHAYGGLSLENVVIVGNGAGIDQVGTTIATVTNSVIRGNSLREITAASQQLVQVTYSNIQGGWPGTGNIDVDAMFVDAVNGDYHLQQGSPCIDAGDSNATGLPPTDFDGGPRFVDDPLVPDTGHNHGVLPIDMGPYEFADCNGNNVDDAIDIQQGISLDCNLNGIPDDCDLLSGGIPDCNANNIPDSCDIATGLDPDCQHNGIPDSCDIAVGVSIDAQPHDGVPDECVFMAAVLADPTGINKSRYISIQVPGSVTAAAADTALQVKLVSLLHPDPPNLPQYPPPNFAAYEGQVRWIWPVSDCPETESPPSTFKCAMLQCTPSYNDWAGSLAGRALHVAGIEVIPSSAYDVRQFAASCRGNEGTCTAVSSALRVNTGRWGDVAAPFQAPSPAPLTQPNITDVAACVDKFKAVPAAIIVARADVNPAIPNHVVDIADVANIVDAFKILVYPFPGPAACQ
ncbi:MAG: right-handed parallel beta-helix repeat-containing protein [Planctomycetes bacterium]|nr:right-handed parallel beta-helix repeat-containing protein [Planctomycetota bacterium]